MCACCTNPWCLPWSFQSSRQLTAGCKGWFITRKVNYRLPPIKCPKCGLGMQEVKFRGVDVDVCFACGGVFLDKGELEHITLKEETKGVMSAILNWFTPETKP